MFFVTIIIEMRASSSFTIYIREKYTYLLDTLKEGDENVKMLCSNPRSSNHRYIKGDSDQLEIITGLSRYSVLSTEPPYTVKRTIWGTSRTKLRK